MMHLEIVYDRDPVTLELQRPPGGDFVASFHVRTRELDGTLKPRHEVRLATDRMHEPVTLVGDNVVFSIKPEQLLARQQFTLVATTEYGVETVARGTIVAG